MLHNVTEVSAESLRDTIAARFPQGYRFITLTCVDGGATWELLYHFDRNYELSHVRVRVPKGAVVPSISGIYACAALVENEVQDLFGVTFEGLTVNYERRFMLAVEAPLAPMVRTPVAQAAARAGEMRM
ncbi:MAG: NADH-quinone oxidoreductase subunit C [bacterium]|nr:NADH-quinone oxidoreductase subunit C [bacterium]